VALKGNEQFEKRRQSRNEMRIKKKKTNKIMGQRKRPNGKWAKRKGHIV
jgi:hypothetical protein